MTINITVRKADAPYLVDVDDGTNKSSHTFAVADHHAAATAALTAHRTGLGLDEKTPIEVPVSVTVVP
jgi:hypothetical protein